MNQPKRFSPLEAVSHYVSDWIGTSSALIFALMFLLGWIIAGPLMRFSEGWHLLITTSSAAITFFMIFAVARVQSKDTKAVQIKLNEIIAVLSGANNSLISLENLSHDEITQLYKRYESLAKTVRNEDTAKSSTESLTASELI